MKKIVPVPYLIFCTDDLEMGLNTHIIATMYGFQSPQIVRLKYVQTFHRGTHVGSYRVK